MWEISELDRAGRSERVGGEEKGGKGWKGGKSADLGSGEGGGQEVSVPTYVCRALDLRIQR